MIGALRAALRHGRPDVLLRYGRSPGDALLCTAVLRELRARGARRLWMQSEHPGLFEHNADVDLVVPYARSYRRVTRLLGGRDVYPDYGGYDAATDRSTPPDRHLIACMCRAAGVRGEIGLRPYLTLTAAERAAGLPARGAIAIQSTGLGARLPMLNKEWGVERFREVARMLRARWPLVQVGAPADPLLDGALDARGGSFRASAALLANALGFVGQVGFMMHLARAVECRAAIVFGGREAPWQDGYTANENLFTPLPCSPCWLWNRCDYERRCLSAIEPRHVVAAVERVVARAGEPLAIDVDRL